jgi:hypothetical protein
MLVHLIYPEQGFFTFIFIQVLCFQEEQEPTKYLAHLQILGFDVKHT